MSNTVLIEAENISKKFCRSLKRTMFYTGVDIARGVINQTPPGDVLRKDEFWALRDVSFKLKRGECLGLIGPNGSGKSTLLRVLNGIIHPDLGYAKIRGNTGALIHVGAGFHPTLTGRENIYVSGAIRGMTQREVREKFDEIVDFSGVREFIDMPVQHYSSGMFVRLGYSVAAHIDPDLLLMDEVLAVGDADFKSKCLDHLAKKMDAGCAPVFVSHAMGSVSEICTRVIVLSKGHIIFDGSVEDGIAVYQEALCKDRWNDKPTDDQGVINGFKVENLALLDEQDPVSGGPLSFSLDCSSEKPGPLRVELIMQSARYGKITIMKSPRFTSEGSGKAVTLHTRIPANPLLPGYYHVLAQVVDDQRDEIVARRAAQLAFMVAPGASSHEKSQGLIDLKETWKETSSI